MTPGKILYPALVFFMLVHSAAPAQSPRAPGYMGIWYKFGQPYEYGYKFSGGLATFSSQHNPMAVYVPQVKKTFFVYCGTAAPDTSHVQIMVSCFDHVTRKVPRPVIVLDKMGVTNPQDNATLSIDSKGYIWVFVSGQGRTRPGQIYKSDKPWSIDTFNLTYAGEILFPQAWWINDTTFLMMHSKVARGRELYWTTGKDGSRWEPSQKLAGAGGHFQVTNIFGNRLYSVFNVCPDGSLDSRTNLYLVYTDDMGKTWRTIDEEVIETPIRQLENKALIHDYSSEKKLVYIHDLNFDDQGNPVILLLTSNDSRPGPQGDPREWIVVSRRNGSWSFSKVCNMPHNYNLGSIYISGDEWRLIGPSDPGSSKYGTGGEMVLWTSPDKGQTWLKSTNITSGSTFNNSYAKRPFNPNDEFYAFWSDGDATKKSVSRIYFTNKNCDKVWMLPYTMKKEWQKPVRVK